MSEFSDSIYDNRFDEICKNCVFYEPYKYGYGYCGCDKFSDASQTNIDECIKVNVDKDMVFTADFRGEFTIRIVGENFYCLHWAMDKEEYQDEPWEDEFQGYGFNDNNERSF